MPGPNSQPQRFVGKTVADKLSGKAARYQQNRQRRADANRNGTTKRP